MTVSGMEVAIRATLKAMAQREMRTSSRIVGGESDWNGISSYVLLDNMHTQQTKQPIVVLHIPINHAMVNPKFTPVLHLLARREKLMRRISLSEPFFVFKRLKSCHPNIST